MKGELKRGAATAATTANESGGGALSQIVEQSEKKRLTERAADSLEVPLKGLFDSLRLVFGTPIDSKTREEKPFADRELSHAVALIAKYDLDPWTKQIYVVRDKRGSIMTIISYDGWVKVLNGQPSYDGFDYEEDIDDDGNLSSVEYLIYDRTRKYPGKYKARMSNFCPKGVPDFLPWGYMPEHMIHIKGLIHAARRTYPVGGAMTDDDAKRTIENQERSEIAERKAVSHEELAARTAPRQVAPVSQRPYGPLPQSHPGPARFPTSQPAANPVPSPRSQPSPNVAAQLQALANLGNNATPAPAPAPTPPQPQAPPGDASQAMLQGIMANMPHLTPEQIAAIEEPFPNVSLNPTAPKLPQDRLELMDLAAVMEDAVGTQRYMDIAMGGQA